MPRKTAPEFYWIESRQLYRKRIKNPYTGQWADVYGKTKASCRANVEKKRKAFVEEQLRQDEEQRRKEDPLVYEYAARWYKLAAVDVKQKRREDYANAINNHICPVIGSLRVREVKYENILEVMSAASGMSKSGQQKIVTTLKRIFSFAERNGLIDKSPCVDLKAGGKESEEKTPLTAYQQRRLLDAVKGTKAEIFVALCLYAGLRREEALGLCWDCVFLDAKVPYIAVRRALNWGGKNKPTLTEELKSKAAKRDIPIPSQLEQLLKDAKEKAKGEYVIANKDGGAPSAATFRRIWEVVTVRTEREIEKTIDGKKTKTWLRVGDKVQNHNVTVQLDFKVTPHQLRHTYITTLILAGANIKTVQYLAGHATPIITLRIYTHLMENRPEDTVGAISNAFGVAEKGTESTKAEKHEELSQIFQRAE